MKKVFIKMSMMALLLLVGMLFATDVRAQDGTLLTAPNSPTIKTTATWMSSSLAAQALTNELQGTITQALDNLPPGGQQFIIWKYKAVLYEAVLESVLTGVNTEKAVQVNFDRMAGAKHLEPVISGLSQAEWQVIFNELVDLLTL